jgi:hypothetical protein
MLRNRINIVVAVAALVYLVAVPTGAWSNTINPADTQSYLTKADFDQAFADAAKAMSRRENTPANREKLRNSGWKRIIGSR